MLFYNAHMNDTTERKQKITVYTDGSCLGNPGPGGWAALLICRGKEKMLVGDKKETTNNQMEMQAVISALTALKAACDIELFTDSKYVMDGATSWIHGWKAKGWQERAGEEQGFVARVRRSYAASSNQLALGQRPCR
mgnify:CR=1 FL=1